MQNRNDNTSTSTSADWHHCPSGNTVEGEPEAEFQQTTTTNENQKEYSEKEGVLHVES